MITTSVSPNQLGNTLDPDNSFVKLPFPVLTLNWHNGYPQAPKQGVKHYGGWFRDADKFNADVSEIGCGVGNFVGPELWTNESGERQYPTMSARAIYVAPIAPKSVWIHGKSENDKGHSQNFLLVQLGILDENKSLVPWTPAIISTGYHAMKYINAAIKAWQSDTVDLRLEHAPGVHPSLFYVPIGTFGNNRKTEMVGKGKKSPIAICQQAPVEWTPGMLEAHFVGDETALAMVEYKALAAEWLADDGKKNAIPDPIDSASGDAFPWN